VPILVRKYHQSHDLPDNFAHRIIVIDYNALHSYSLGLWEASSTQDMMMARTPIVKLEA